VRPHQAHAKPRVRLSNEALAAKTEAVFSMLEAHARTGRRCPSLFHMVTGLGVSTNTAQALLERLREQGRITWRMDWSRDAGPLRVVTIVATGQTTQSYAEMRRPAAKKDVDPLEAAKDELRKTGAHVWSTSIDGIGPPGHVRVDREFLRPAEVIRRAAALGRH